MNISTNTSHLISVQKPIVTIKDFVKIDGVGMIDGQFDFSTVPVEMRTTVLSLLLSSRTNLVGYAQVQQDIIEERIARERAWSDSINEVKSLLGKRSYWRILKWLRRKPKK